jgi:cell division protease FtsH
VLLLAATNRVDVLDPALLRPGRISRRVTVPLPDEAGRAAILGVHLRGVELEGGEGVKADVARQLAAVTPGFSGGQVTATACLSCPAMLEAVRNRNLLTRVSMAGFV